MQEKIDQIIEFLISEISTISDAYTLNLERISEQLLQEGYTEGEIHKAVEWVVLNLNQDRSSFAERLNRKNPPSLRVLIAEELNFFSSEAYGYIIQLQTLGIVSPLQIEQIIERCFLNGLNRVEIGEVKTVVSQVLLGKEIENDYTDTVYMPGNDIIN